MFGAPNDFSIHDVTAFRAEGYFHRISEDVHAIQNGRTGIFRKTKFFCGHL